MAVPKITRNRNRGSGPVPGSRSEKRAVPVRFLKYHVEPETDPLKYQIDTTFFFKKFELFND